MGPHEVEMSAKTEAGQIELFQFEREVELLAADYQTRHENLTHKAIAEGMGRIFAVHCLHEYGIRGYEYANQGIRAILDTLSDGIRKRGGKT